MDEFAKSIDTKIIPNTIIFGHDKNQMPELNPDEFYFGHQIFDG